jgi:transcriptional regulator with XRE-family HTH domain
MPQGQSGESAGRVLDPEEVLGRHLRALREKAGLTQQQVADQMRLRGFPMHRSAIAKIEASDPATRRPVRVNEAVALADVLGVPVADLIVDPNAQRRRIANSRRREEEEELREATMQLAALERELQQGHEVLASTQAQVASAQERLRGTQNRVAMLMGRRASRQAEWEDDQ